MDEFSRDLEHIRPVRSLSLEEIVNARPPFFRGIVEVAKTGLMIWGALSLSAAAGYATLHLQGGPAEPVLQSEAVAAAPSAEADGAAARPIADAAAYVTETALPTELAPTEIAARLPRPRPDEPIVTGSIARIDASAPAAGRARHADPCEAWNNLGMPFRLRCIREMRADEPRYFPPYPQYRW